MTEFNGMDFSTIGSGSAFPGMASGARLSMSAAGSAPSIFSSTIQGGGGGSGWFNKAGAAVGAFMANPIVGLGTTLLSTIGGIYDTIVARREAKEAQKKQERLQAQMIAEEKRRWDENLKIQQQQLGISRTAALANMEQTRRNNRIADDDANTAKLQSYIARWMQMLNDPVGGQRFISAMKGGR